MIFDCYPFLEGPLVSRRTVRCPMPKREKRNELVRVAFSRFEICPDIESTWILLHLYDSAIGSPIPLYSAPQEMVSTIIAPCLSPPPHLPAPPPLPPPPPPLAMYILRVRSTLLPTLKHSSTYWNWTSQERLSVRTLTLFKKIVSLVFFRIRCGFCRRDSRLCYGSETGFSFFPRKDRHSSTGTYKIHRLRHKCFDKGRSYNTNSSRCSRIHRPGKASPPHWSGAMGTWESFSWFYYCGVKGEFLLSYLPSFVLIILTVFERFHTEEHPLGSLHRRFR